MGIEDFMTRDIYALLDIKTKSKEHDNNDLDMGSRHACLIFALP